MVQKEKSSSPNLMPAEFAEMGKKRVEEFVSAQTELLKNSRRRPVNGSIAPNQKQILRPSLQPN